MNTKEKTKSDAFAVDAGTAMPNSGELPLETSKGLPIPEIGIPWLTALRILEEAHPHFQEKRGVGFGELIFKYQKGECKITRVETIHGTFECYRVQIMGSGITIMGKDSSNFQPRPANK